MKIRKKPVITKAKKLKSRVAMSNPFADIPHDELLERAGIVSPKKHYKTVDLPNGRITLSPNVVDGNSAL